MKSTDSIANDELIRDLASADYTTRWFAAEVLGTKRDLNESQQNELMRIAPASDVGEVLVWGLGMMNAEGVENLIGTFLEHENNYFRWRAAEALRDLGTPRAITILTRHLRESSDAETRWKCAWALGEIGDIGSFDVLWTRAEHDYDRYVRWKSVWGITRLKGDIVARVKRKLEEGPSEFMAWRAAWILGRVGGALAVSTLESMKDTYADSKYVKYQVALAIDTLKGDRDDE